LEVSTGIDGLLGYLMIIICVIIGYSWMNGDVASTENTTDNSGEEEKIEDDSEPLRNFSKQQLERFDGKIDENTEEVKPVYLSLSGTVFDVSNARNFYGPDGPYEVFAGHECGVALAKMSFDKTYLDDISGCKSLNFGENNELENWIEKFTHIRCYPIVGHLIPDEKIPDASRVLTKSDLAANNGTGETPDGYATAPIYVGVGEKVFDVSFGGVTFYGKGCSYELFAGRDVSRALAKMSFKPEDTENTSILDLSEKEIKVMNDWIKSFKDRKKYPIVGVLEK